jgi:putative pyruvate formate lyase activating enzyme
MAYSKQKDSTPLYITAFKTGALDKKAEQARRILKNCRLCPRECGIDRTAGEKGVCRTEEKAVVSSFNPHFGEESPLVGSNGSGTIFFTFCNLMCSFCQNYDISHGGAGEAVTEEQLAQMMLLLQNQGCHNINFVSPTHVVPQILAAVKIAVKEGLCVPIVYNTGAYDKVETLKLLDGIIDIYMPDFKFWNPEIAKITCNAEDYPEAARNALIEMNRQVGDLVTDESGIAVRGLIIRHLVLPRNLAGTREVMKFIAEKISSNSYVNIMPQYRPCGSAHETKGLNRTITEEEFETALKEAAEEGIKRLDSRRSFLRI